ENLAIRSPDVYNGVAPHVGARAADAAYAVAADECPGFDRITHDRLLRNRAQPESKHANLNPVLQKAVLEAAPRHREGADCNYRNEHDRPAAGCRWHQRHSDHRSQQRQQDDQTPRPPGMRLFRQHVAMKCIAHNSAVSYWLLALSR